MIRSVVSSSVSHGSPMDTRGRRLEHRMRDVLTPGTVTTIVQYPLRSTRRRESSLTHLSGRQRQGMVPRDERCLFFREPPLLGTGPERLGSDLPNPCGESMRPATIRGGAVVPPTHIRGHKSSSDQSASVPTLHSVPVHLHLWPRFCTVPQMVTK